MLLSSGTTCDASLANSTQNKRNNVHLKAKRGATGGRWDGFGGWLCRPLNVIIVFHGWEKRAPRFSFSVLRNCLKVW